MKKLKLTKFIASTLVAVSVLALNPIGASAEWKQDGTGWWYTEGSSWATGWRQIESKWYYFYADGYMAYNTVIDGYIIGSDGVWDGTTKKTLLNRDDFNNFSSTDASKGNLIDWAKKNGYDWAYNVIYPGSTTDEKFKTSKNIGLGDSLEDIGKAYGIVPNHTFAIRYDELCATYPKWTSLSVTNGLDMQYYEDGNTYEIRYYLNASHKVVMIAYFKNMKYITKNDMKWN